MQLSDKRSPAGAVQPHVGGGGGEVNQITESWAVLLGVAILLFRIKLEDSSGR